MDGRKKILSASSGVGVRCETGKPALPTSFLTEAAGPTTVAAASRPDSRSASVAVVATWACFYPVAQVTRWYINSLAWIHVSASHSKIIPEQR